MGWAAAGYAAMAAAAAAGAASSIQQGRSAAAWNEYNAKIAKRNAEMAKLVAEKAAGRKRSEVQRVLSRQRALYGQAGVEFEGSPLLVMEDTAAEGELDALLIEYGGLTQAQAYRSQAVLDRMKARSAKRAGYYGATKSILGGASSAGGYYGSARYGKSSGG